MRFLIIQTAFIGDIVLTTPFFEALKTRFPDAELHIVTTPQGCAILDGDSAKSSVFLHPIDKRKSIFKSIRDLIDAVNKRIGNNVVFDAVFCIHRSPRSLWIGKRFQAKRRIAFDSFFSRLLGYETQAYPPYDSQNHYADKPLVLLEKYFLNSEKIARLQPKLELSEESKTKVMGKIRNSFGGGNSSEYVVISPFSVWGTKMWFADRFARLSAEVSKFYGLPVVIIGEDKGYERVVGETIVEKVSQAGGQALSLVGNTSLAELKAVIAGAKFLVSNDSAPVHIASAFQVPTVAIFGPTSRKWGFFPLSSQNRVVEREELSCRPCHLHGPMRCPKKHFKCMDEIAVEDVFNAVQSLMRDNNHGEKRG